MARTMVDPAGWTPAALAAATGGALEGEPRGERVLIDSRLDVKGALFVALRGPNHDGHAYLADVFAAGATGAVVSRDWREGRAHLPGPVIVVEDTLVALQDLARAHRDRFDIPFVAVTGSSGKTTVKELLAAALAPLGPVHRTAGNLNNHIGVPLTLLALTPEHRAAVIEMGMNHPGEISLLSRLTRPRVAMITNVSEAHLKGVGSRAGVARAKAEIAEGLDPDGLLVIPAGDADLEAALAGYTGRRTTFGGEGADVVAERMVPRPDGTTVVFDGVEVATALPGRHSGRNLLAVLVAARELGVSAAAAAPGLATVRPLAGRLRPRHARGVTILDDTYNANPASLAAALDVLDLARAGRRVAVLGPMLELGDEETRLHHEAGADAADVDLLVTVGDLAANLGEGAVDAGLHADRWVRAEDWEEAVAAVGDLAPGDCLLVKGSRGARLERVVEAVIASLGGEA